MATNINLIAFGTFGSPHGFRQTFFSGNKEIGNSTRTFDLNSNAIKVVPDARLYAIRRERYNHVHGVSYCLYTFAKEKNSERGGTFIGSGLLFTDELPDESLTIATLNDFHDKVVARNVANDVIQVNHSDDLLISEPDDFDKVGYNLKPVDAPGAGQSATGCAVVYTKIEADRLSVLFKKALDLLAAYDIIYFTDSNEIAEFVYQKALYKVLKVDGFEQECAHILETRKQKVLQSISTFEQKQQALLSDKERTISELKNQLETDKATHAENEKTIREAESNIKKVASYYEDFCKKTEDYANQLRSGKKLDEVLELYQQNLLVFSNSVQTLQPPKYIKSISKLKAKSGLQPDDRSGQGAVVVHQYPDDDKRPRRVRRKKGSPKLKILLLLLALLWLLTLAYFLWLDYPVRKTGSLFRSNPRTSAYRYAPKQSRCGIAFLKKAMAPGVNNLFF